MTYTVTCNYGATGEGQSFMVWIGYAANEEQALKSFNRAFDPYFGQGATVYKGLKFDFPGAQGLLGHSSIASIERMADSNCMWHFTASNHINCS